MASHRSRRTAASLAAVLALAVALPACGNRENERGNPGGGPQSQGIDTGTNPADASQTAPKADPGY